MTEKSMEERLIFLETKLKEIDTLKMDLEKKEREIQNLKDIERIKVLQCAYGYYLEHWMVKEVVDCFADHPGTMATFIEGSYTGLTGVKRYFERMPVLRPEFLHMVMQVSPVITLDPDGERAKGRWYGYGTICDKPRQNRIDPTFMSVVYEMVYIKENGVWKILVLDLMMHYAWSPTRSLSGVEDHKTVEPVEAENHNQPVGDYEPDKWADYDTQYPSGFIYPFHFTHPVTGAKTEERSYNATLNLNPNPFAPK